MKIETERLLIRLMSLNDVDDSFEHRGDAQVSRYTTLPLTRAQTKARIQAQLDNPWLGENHEKLMLAIELKQEKKLIGEFMFKFTDVSSATGEIGYRLNRRYQSKGYAYEAVSAMIYHLFNTLPLKKISAVCITLNTASWKLMEKLGMQQEATFRSHFQLGEQRFDAFSYAILARD